MLRNTDSDYQEILTDTKDIISGVKKLSTILNPIELPPGFTESPSRRVVRHPFPVVIGIREVYQYPRITKKCVRGLVDQR